jgi:hypothetical protein
MIFLCINPKLLLKVFRNLPENLPGKVKDNKDV